MTIQDILQEIPSLSIDEREHLIHALIDSLTEPAATNQHTIFPC